MTRYFCLCPPPMNREVIRPALLRPPVFGLPLVSDFSGFDRVSLSKEGWFTYRMAGDVGLYVFIAMFVLSGWRLAVGGWEIVPTANRQPLTAAPYTPSKSSGAFSPSLSRT